MLTTRYHLDEAHLRYYDEKLKSWASSQPVKTLPSSLYPWTLTEKAGAVTCWPVGGTELKPTVDFLFTETPPASGDKGPDNPSTITGVESVTVGRSGKNIMELQPRLGAGYLNFEKKSDGSIRIYGTTPSSTYDQVTLFPASTILGTLLHRGMTYTASYYGIEEKLSLQVYSKKPDNSYTHLGSCSVSSNKLKFTVPDNAVNVWVRIQTNAGNTVDDTVKVQIELGSNATSFEPCSYTSATVSLGETRYGGSIDLATGVMTVTHFLEQLSSSTNIVATGFSEGQSAYRVGMYLSSSKERLPYPITSLEGYACNSFPVVADPSVNSAPCFGLAGGSILTYLCLTKTMLGVGDGAAYDAVRSAVLSFLGSHQVKVAGKLATPYTVQLTPTQILSLSQPDKYTPRLNTVYSDASSVQVTYVKSPIRTEFELQQAIVSQGGNI